MVGCIYGFNLNIIILGDQEVKSLKTLCKLDCGWKGELRNLNSHLENECENAPVFCPNKCCLGVTKIERKNLANHIENECPRRQCTCQNCGEMIEYCNMKRHLQNKCPKRQYSCPHCKEAGCYDERTTTHLENCPKVRIRCPKCLNNIFRSSKVKHHLYCTDEPVCCKYSEIGCTERPLRKQLERHENNSQLHLTIAKNKVLELTKALILKNTVIFKMVNFERKKARGDTFYSNPFFTSKSGYKMCMNVEADGEGAGEGTHVSVYAHLMKGENDDSLTWPFSGTVTIELLNQLEDKNHYRKTVTFLGNEREICGRLIDVERGQGYGHPQFISHSKLDYKRNNCQYLKDDTLVFRVSVKVPDYKPWLECTI